MPLPIEKGSNAPGLQSQVITYDRTKGGGIVEEWAGLSQAKAVAYWNGHYMYAQRGQISLKDGRAEMRFEWSSEGGGANPSSLAVTIDRWEIAEPNEQKDLFQHPKFLAQIWLITFDVEWQMNVIKIIRKHAGDAQSGTASSQNDMLVAVNDYLDGEGLTTTDKSEASEWLKFYRLYANGQTHYQSSSWALRHTTNCPANWERNVADTNRNRIYSNNQFMSEVMNAGLWIYPLPARLQYKLNNAYAAWIVDNPYKINFVNGWLKGASQEASIGNGRIEIQTSYKMDQWPSFVYPTI